MAAPAEAPGTQENQLSKSIQHLKVLLRERWHGRADKRLSVQTLGITTHTPLRPGLSAAPVATTGNLWKVIG